jgi:hypothetical protein
VYSTQRATDGVRVFEHNAEQKRHQNAHAHQHWHWDAESDTID